MKVAYPSVLLCPNCNTIRYAWFWGDGEEFIPKCPKCGNDARESTSYERYILHYGEIYHDSRKLKL